MYQDFFQLNALPFNLTPNTQFFCELQGHQEALDTLLFALKSGEGFIKITGEVGSGKTLICRKLLESLDSDFATAYLPNPQLSPVELRLALARELGIDVSQTQDQHELINDIYKRLIELRELNKKAVLIIDEAQAMSDDSLEALRLLTNLETNQEKLLQIALFGQPELNARLNQSNLRQLKQRIGFSYYLPKMSRDELDDYLHYRLLKAGYNYGQLFSKKARDILYRASGGTPRLINILCHKALLVAFGRGEKKISHQAIRLAIYDTDSVLYDRRQRQMNRIMLLISILLLGLGVFLFI